jgi:tripartite-type tricarboxylate transporter receptor subunit TctC
MKRRIFVGAGVAALAGAPVWAQTKIGGDVRFYCGFAPGGTADLLCRILADAVTPEVGQKVIVDTKTGASGFIANETVANGAPDGRTIGLAAMAAMCVAPVMPGQKLPINVDTDLTPIANIAGVYNMLVFGKHVPFRTVPELIEQARKNPGKLSYGSAGQGSLTHLTMELFKQQIGAFMLHIPYRGIAPAFTDLLGGQTQAMFPGLAAALPHLRSGRVRALAVTGKARSDQLKEVPTLEESGFKGFDAIQWYGSVGPAGIPAEIVHRLNETQVAVLKDPELRERLAVEAVEPMPMTPEQFGQYIRADIERWTALAKAKNIHLDE